MDTKPLRSFLEIPYVDLETMNLSAKKKRKDGVNEKEIKEFYLNYLKKEKRLKAVTIGFSDLEGRFHMIDYDKKFFLGSYDNMTFDGSSIRGYSRQAESDLRLDVDWGAFWWLPSDVFGSGKVLVMGRINGQDGKPYEMDIRGVLKTYLEHLYSQFNDISHIAKEPSRLSTIGAQAATPFNEKVGLEL